MQELPERYGIYNIITSCCIVADISIYFLSIYISLPQQTHTNRAKEKNQRQSV